MNYTEFYVTKGAAANNLNGGGPRMGVDDGPVASIADATAVAVSATEWSITNNGGTGWGDSAVDDMVLFDAAGEKLSACISQLSYGGNANVILVVETITDWGPGVRANKAIRVGGAWATIQYAATTAITLKVNAAGDPPRVNIGPGTWDEEVTFANNGTTAIPITFEGYSATAGDLRETNTRVLVQPTSITGSAAVTVSGTEVILRNVYARSEVAAKIGLAVTGNYNTIIGCQGHSTTTYGIYSTGTGGKFSRCIVDGCGDAVGDHGFYVYGNSSIVADCVAQNCVGNGFYVPGTYCLVLRCRAYGNGTDGIRMDSSTALCVECEASYNTGHGINVVTQGSTVVNIIVSCVAWGNTDTDIACNDGGANRYFGLFTDNFYEDIHANLLPIGLHNNTTDNPYVGTSLATCVANDWKKSLAASGRGSYSLLLPDGLTSYPDAGAVGEPDGFPLGLRLAQN
ncbi:MAG: right-handed parallel beta-helix repeat-containing protein [Phycisphaerae bacterium]|nr:right-handed parallel beta-helix repeat-containing protein [Phycisphaerae bacterium]